MSENTPMLTDTKLRNAKPQEKPYKLFDGTYQQSSNLIL
jgi:hypothetical protein